MTRVDALYFLSTGHLLRILNPLEEPPHLTADLISHSVYYSIHRGPLFLISAYTFASNTVDGVISVRMEILSLGMVA